MKAKIVLGVLLVIVVCGSASYLPPAVDEAINGGLVAERYDAIESAIQQLYEPQGMWPATTGGLENWVIPEPQFVHEPPYVIGVSHSFLGCAWMRQYHEEIVQEAARFPDLIKEVIYTDAAFNVEKQIADLHDLINRGCDAILVDATSPTALNPVLDEAVSKGIVVVSMNNIVTNTNIMSRVSTDEVMFGAYGAKWLVNKLGGKGKILVIRGSAGVADDVQRWEGAKAVFDQFPEIEIVGIGWAEYSYDKGKQVARELLAAHPDVDGAWSCGGQMMRAFVDTLLELGMPLIPCAGEDQNGFLRQIKELQDQGFDGIAASKPTWECVYALRFALMALQGQQVPRNFFVPDKMITIDNVDQWIRPEFSDELWVDTTLTPEVLRKLGF